MDINVSPKIKTINKAWIFYITSFTSYLYNGIIGPLFIVYLLSIHINPAQIGLLLGVERLSIIIFEFPTGIFADKYGQKKSLLISFFLLSGLFLAIFFSNNFYSLLALSVLWGIAYTFQSGAKESLMIDNLDLKENDERRNYVFTRISIFGNVGFFLGGIIAAVLAFYYLRSIWLIASFFNLILFFLYFFFVKESLLRENLILAKSSITKIISTAKDNLKFVFSDKIIFLFIAIAVFFGLAISIYGLAYPIFLKNSMNIPNYYFGFLGSLSALVGILGALLGERLTKKKGYYFTTSFFVLSLFVLFIIFGLTNIFWLALIIFVSIEFAINGWYPIFQSFFNKFIPSKMRSSVLSISSTVSLIAIALGEILAGVIIIKITASLLIAFTGVIFIFIVFLLFGIKKYSDQIKKPASA